MSLLYVAPFLVAALWLFLPVIAGQESLFMRDVLNTHLPMKWFQAAAMESGELPLIDPYRSGGQPHMGNPNTVPLYPDNLLYVLASPLWAFNAHFWMHFLLAPLAVLYLGRQVGMGRAARWSAGVFYATGGYYLSTLNLYNLSAATTLTPAFLGACIALSRRGERRRAVVLAAGLWALLVLGGDPMTAVAALAAGVVAAAVAGDEWLMTRAAALRLVTAVLLGTLVAAPQVVEFLRIVPASYRGVQGYSVAAATAASWSPANLLDWLLPMPFGEPDLLFWGERFHAGRRPLLHTFYPGLIVFVLAMVASRRGHKWVSFSWGLVGVGTFFAMGSYNPLASWMLGLPGMKIFRLPVKLWVLAACGLAILAGFGLQRFLDRQDDHRLRRWLAGLLTLLTLAAIALGLGRQGAASVLHGWMPARIPVTHAEAEVGRWLWLCVLSAGLLALALLLTWWAADREDGRRRILVGGLLLALHVAAQVVFLRALVPTEPIDVLLARHPMLDDIPSDARLVHGDAGALFGPVGFDLTAYPDAGLGWLQRDTFEQLYPPAGILAGRRYEFWSSPEGLDSFLTRAVVQALPLLEDSRRLSLLEATE